MKKKRLYLYILISFAISTVLTIISLFDHIQHDDKPGIIVAGIGLFFSFIALLSFLLIYIKYRKPTANNDLLKSNLSDTNIKDQNTKTKTT